jgi:glycine/D-amino acid oxidase-like deaminating enzyme
MPGGNGNTRMRMDTMRGQKEILVIEEAGAVVIGSGALGASTAFHLAALGQQGVVLVDRHELASQTSPRAAGLTQQIRPESDMTRLAMLSVQKIVRFTEETGEPMVSYQSGSVKMARTDADERQVRAEIDAGRGLGLDIHEISAHDLARLTPFARAEGVRAMWYTPSDLYLEPVQIPLGYARGAERLGAALLPNTTVTAIETRDGGVSRVMTSRGAIRTPIVVDAAGAWARLVGEQLGIRVPIVPVRHQLMITEPITGVETTQPICRVIDANVYVRPEKGGLMLGGYEQDPHAYDMNGVLAGFQINDLPLDITVLRSLAELVREQFPVLQDAPVREHRGGLPTMTADGRHIVGPVPGVRGFYAATGCCVGGLSISPAVGQMLAELILTGTSSVPLDQLAMSRFGPDLASDAQLRAACLSTYTHQYSGGWSVATESAALHVSS